jgi:hypothetical protein
MPFLSETSIGSSWLKQFHEAEREIAAELIDQTLLVSRDDFVDGLRDLVDELVRRRSDPARKLALFAERPIKKIFGTIPAFFRNSRHGRARGTGAPPIVVDPRNQEVGSEGIVAQFITDYCRRNPLVAVGHPGPTKMRCDRVGEIVILTDFLGSGNRVRRMLESFRYVATLRSWRSYGLMRFVVIAHSGTSDGVAAVQSHKLRPEVSLRMGCPTISNTFRGAQRSRIEALCNAYPVHHPEPLGYGDIGALIAFAHGCPNNVPPILHSGALGWIPLFKGRSTSDSSAAFLPEGDDLILDQRTQRLLKIRDTRKVLASSDNRRWISAMMLLAAVETGCRTAAEISARTHLNLAEVRELVTLARSALWLTHAGRLTHLGHNELVRLRRRRKQAPVLSTGSNNFYYPTQLRAP